MKLKILLALAFLIAFVVPRSSAQTINAASCSSTDVQTALSAVSVDGNIVAIPACTGGVTWSTTVTYSGTKSITILGAGSQTITGGNDQTVIKDNLATSNLTALSVTVPVGKTVRISGITIEAGTRSVVDNGSLQVHCNDTIGELRIDHSHIANLSTGIGLQDCFGVMDHNVFDEPSGNNNYLHVWNAQYNRSTSNGNGDGSWASASDFGTAKFMYLESNIINTGTDDCTFGGRVVGRFNTMNTGGNWQTHPTGGGGADERGCRAYEVYKNTVGTGLAPTSPQFNFFFLSAGGALVWGNNATGAYSNFITIHSMRRDNSTYNEAATPAGWGYCGTSFNGTGSAWDQNTSSTTGYACIDQPGRGQGDLITGTMPTAVNSTTGTIAWVHELLDPVYSWNNTWSSDGGCGGCGEISDMNPDVLTINQDFYSSVLSASCSGASCTSGVGSGTLSARPASCTTGTAFWATDQGSWNLSGSGGQGVLYKCTATNTWTLSYTPLTFPHPLITSTQTTVTSQLFGMTQLSTANPLASATLQFGVGRLWDTACVWNNINTSAGVFTYSAPCLAEIDDIVAAGARPDFVFGKTPIWATSGGVGTGASPPSDVGTTNAIVKAMVDSLVSMLAARHPGVHWIMEGVNEADLASEWNGTMAQIVAMNTAIKTEAHAQDSQILVGGPSGSNFNASNVHLYSDGNNLAGTAGAAASMDFINIHAYLQSCATYCASPTVFDTQYSRVDALTAVGQPLAGLPVWFTEGDWGGTPGPSGGASQNSAFTAAQKRQYLAQQYMFMLIHGAASFEWYAFDSHPDNLPAGFGSLCEGTPATSCTPNQAATNYNTMYNWLVGATYTGTSLTCAKSASGTYTCPLLSSPASTGIAELIFNPTTTETITLPTNYTNVLNWDGSATPIVSNQIVAGADVVLAIVSAATPTFSPVAGNYSTTQSVTISSATSGATICFTTDGTTPTSNGSGTCTHGTTFTVPVSVSSSETIEAIASKSGLTDSGVGSAHYAFPVATPVLTPGTNTYTTPQTVTITDATGGATICFTTDGTLPTANGAGTCTHGTTYSGSVSVTITQTIKAIGSLSGSTDSALGSAIYTINVTNPPVAPAVVIFGMVQSTGSAIVN